MRCCCCDNSFAPKRILFTDAEGSKKARFETMCHKCLAKARGYNSPPREYVCGDLTNPISTLFKKGREESGLEDSLNDNVDYADYL